MPGSQASTSQEQGSTQVQAALAELEWAQVLESQAEPESPESVPELDLLAGMDSQAGQVTQAGLESRVQVPGSARAGPESQERESAQQAASAQERESAQQEQQESQAGPDPPQSSAHTHARSRHT